MDSGNSSSSTSSVSPRGGPSRGSASGPLAQTEAGLGVTVPGDQLVGGEPVGDLGAVDRAPVQLLDLGAEFDHDVGSSVPVDGELVVGPVQDVVLVQPGEEQLAAEAVVVADAAAGDREAEDPVEDHGVLDQLGVPACLRVGVLVLRSSRTRGRR